MPTTNRAFAEPFRRNIRGSPATDACGIRAAIVATAMRDEMISCSIEPELAIELTIAIEHALAGARTSLEPGEPSIDVLVLNRAGDSMESRCAVA